MELRVWKEREGVVERHNNNTNNRGWCWVCCVMPQPAKLASNFRVPFHDTSPQLPATAPGKSREDGPCTWVTVTYMD